MMKSNLCPAGGFLLVLLCSSAFGQSGNQAPVLTNLSDTKAQLWNAGLTVVDTNAVVSDTDSPNFAGGALIVRVLSAAASDRLSVRSTSTVGQINVLGNEVRLVTTTGTTSIGTLVNPIPVSGATILRINLKATATPAVATTLLRNITYRNQSAAALTATRRLEFKVLDGDGGTSTAVVKSIRVGTLNGTYNGTFVGSLNVFGVPQTIPGSVIGVGQNTINTVISGTSVSVNLPGIAATGSGTVTSTGTFSANSTGSISGLGVQVAFSGTVKLNANGSASGSGSWTIVNTPGVTGSGTWTMSRP